MVQTTFVDKSALRAYLITIYQRVASASTLITAIPADNLEERQFVVWPSRGNQVNFKIKFTKDTRTGGCELQPNAQPAAWEKQVLDYLDTIRGFLKLFVIRGSEINAISSFSDVVAAIPPVGNNTGKKKHLVVYWDVVAGQMAHAEVDAPLLS